jgi:carboxymethylenebutenolidase
LSVTSSISLPNIASIVTGPVARFARQIAGQGYIVAAPSSYHEFTGPEPLAYDVPGTDAGNDYKIKKV